MYVTQQKLVFQSKQIESKHLVWQHLPQREICDLCPSIKPMFREKKDRVSPCFVFFPTCLPVTVSHSMTRQRRLEGSEPTTVSVSILRGDEAFRRCQRTFSRTWRLLSMLHITALKGEGKVVLFLFFVLVFVFVFVFKHHISNPNKTINRYSTYGKPIILPEGPVWCSDQMTLELKTSQSQMSMCCMALSIVFNL